VEKKKRVVVVGLGEVGKPLFQLASGHCETIGVDIEPPQARIENVDVLHICYPFAITDFVGETARYIERFKPSLTIINSTVAVGTTRAIAELTGGAVANSPVRGKHARMLDDLRHYVKFVGGMDLETGQAAAVHFQSLGLKTKVLSSPEATELAKLTETTYFGLLIAWAQETERYCDRFSQSYAEVASFWEEVKYLPPVTFFPGIIGGHCVMPNIEILSRFDHSPTLQAIEDSNRKKVEREVAREGKHTSIKDELVSPASTQAPLSPTTRTTSFGS
jgi:UDP-N-acetyl-D-mannosaminuronate dehydrogenase